jgi:hypothetical protein
MISARQICLILSLSALVNQSAKAAVSVANGMPASSGVQITQLTNRLRVEIGGKLFTEYYFTGVPRPCFYPLIGPAETPMTRDWPFKDVPKEEHDHLHHRSLWLSHSLVNGQDCWTEGTAAKPTGTIVHTGFDEIKSGQNEGIIRSRDDWVGTNGVVLCSDERTFRVFNTPGRERVFDFEVTLHASHGDVTFGDEKDGFLGLRLAETMRLKPNKFYTNQPTGHIVNSQGFRDGETWGKRADWVDYHGPDGGRTLGVAIFDHPANPRHPTWWHVRDYGLFAANPFGQSNFESLPDKHAGDFLIPAGQSATFRYRIYLHEGDEIQAKVAEHYQAYANSASAAPSHP